jgi:hypothetical protein
MKEILQKIRDLRKFTNHYIEIKLEFKNTIWCHINLSPLMPSVEFIANNIDELEIWLNQTYIQIKENIEKDMERKIKENESVLNTLKIMKEQLYETADRLAQHKESNIQSQD